MTESCFERFADEDPDAATILRLAEHYEAESDLIPAFGYYLIALSLVGAVEPKLANTVGALAFKLGEEGFALKCFRMAIEGRPDQIEQERSTRAITTLFKISGFEVPSARPAPFGLSLPPLLRVVPATHQPGTVPCLTISAETSLQENGLLSIADSHDYRGIVFNFAVMASIAPNFNADLFLLHLIRDLKPALILFRHASLTHRASDPRVETLMAIRDQMKAPLIGLYYDIAKPSFQRICRAYLHGLDGAITWDRPMAKSLPAPPGTRILDLWTPLPLEQFRFRNQPRIFDIGFVGSMEPHYNTRQAYLNGLSGAGIEVETRGKAFGGAISTEEMVTFLQSCKIVLNFSSTAVISPWENDDKIVETHHVKGRVFEVIASGALLFETHNEFTQRFFTAGEHYVEFSDIEDLKRKLAFYLSNQEERERMAQSARTHYLANYTSTHYWRHVKEMISEIKANPKASP